MAGIRQPAEHQAAPSLPAERDSLTGQAGSRLPAITERLTRAGQGVADHRGRDVTFAIADLRDQAARVTGTHPHAGTQPRLHLGGGEALDLKPGEEAPLCLLDVLADRTARLPEQPFELGDQAGTPSLRRGDLAGAGDAGSLPVRVRGISRLNQLYPPARGQLK